eukprot:15280389-Heterocapsa_arctica.AAC.1
MKICCTAHVAEQVLQSLEVKLCLSLHMACEFFACVGHVGALAQGPHQSSDCAAKACRTAGVQTW